jgi:excisionase family DNA binding protein
MHGVAAQFSPTAGVEPDPFAGRLALSVKSAAKAIDVTERHMWSLVGTGEIPSFKIRGSRRINVGDLKNFLAKQQAAA